MALLVYLGDEATAAGYRLAGVETRVPPLDEAAAALRRATTDGAELILLSGALADHVPAEELRLALTQERPLVTIVPDVYGNGAPADLARQVRAALGIES